MDVSSPESKRLDSTRPAKLEGQARRGRGRVTLRTSANSSRSTNLVAFSTWTRMTLEPAYDSPPPAEPDDSPWALTC